MTPAYDTIRNPFIGSECASGERLQCVVVPRLHRLKCSTLFRKSGRLRTVILFDPARCRHY